MPFFAMLRAVKKKKINKRNQHCFVGQINTVKDNLDTKKSYVDSALYTTQNDLSDNAHLSYCASFVSDYQRIDLLWIDLQ